MILIRRYRDQGNDDRYDWDAAPGGVDGIASPVFQRNISKIPFPCFPVLFLFFLLWSLFPTQPAGAVSIEIEPALGFNGVFRLNDWTPLTVVVENRHKGLQGRLEAVVTSGSEYQDNVFYTTYSQEVDLPTYSKKTYSFTIRIDSYVHPLMIRLKRGNEILLSKSLNLRDRYTTKPILLFADEKPEDLSPQITEAYQPVYAPVQFFPENWFGYLGVKAVILKAGRWNDLKPRQYAGLIHWVENGGYVITMGGLYHSALASERLDRLLSLKVGGVERVQEIPALQSFFGAGLTSQDPFLLLKVSAPQAETLLREREFPLILKKERGLGQLLFTAFDATVSPFKAWPGRGMFWEKVLSLGPSEKMDSIFPDEKGMASFLLPKMTARFPFFYLIFILLLGYLVIITFLMKRIENRREQALKTLWVLCGVILLSSSAGYGFGFFIQNQNHVSHNGILHIKINGPQALAQWRYTLGIYTQKDGEFQFPLGREDWVVTGIPTENPDPEKFLSYALHESNNEHFLTFFHHRWSHRFYSLSGFWEVPVRAKAEKQDQDLIVTIENRFALPLRNVHIFFKGRLFPFGTVGPKEKLVKRLPGKVRDPEEFLTPQEIEVLLKSGQGTGQDSLKAGVELELTKELWISIQRRHQEEKKGRVVLVGRIDDLVYPETLPAKPYFGSGATWLEWELPWES